MYFQLQNLEKHSSVLESARDELLAMLAETISLALEDGKKGILRIDTYDAKRPREFINEEQEGIMMEWAKYLSRRSLGKHPELFGTIDEAQRVTKNTWQILSEELGDGDPNENHVFVYAKLLKEVGCSLPDPGSRDFIKPSFLAAMDDERSWKAVVAQLLISLLPLEFLPEVLGFNLHYELVSLEAMTAARELKDLGVDPSYFLLHICIGNADSGHTAMALMNVIDYLETIKETGCKRTIDEQ
ncbi:iron-containing redox enzyme family protein [Aspergillus homomorphus CBS 101889]|uniref:Uncharacterized protein n=1 Tax=Aspergillus homomorphus (strain CBS 101889) TaxID=1450537 RepID=A0A395IAI1_ASPHC|nr:hypothetical protein BO97DRAFT_410539 [Aspergillus homomorphus CBS 101889]RAL17046.1 hypothetical protein BO97DRAFT_410539 [Aspergillus homomorphus CBS 101889]